MADLFPLVRPAQKVLKLGTMREDGRATENEVTLCSAWHYSF